MLRLQAEECNSTSLEKKMQCPGCLITVLTAPNCPDSIALSPQGPRKMGKGLPQDPDCHIAVCRCLGSTLLETSLDRLGGNNTLTEAAESPLSL